MKFQHCEDYQHSDAYQYRLTELRPVFWAQLIEGTAVMYWFEGEDPSDIPTQLLTNDEKRYMQEGPARPLLRDKRTIDILRDYGPEFCIRHINKNIANSLMDEYEKIADTSPKKLEKQYLAAIDRFYEWFWERREKSDEKLFARFLRHLNHQRQLKQEAVTWYTLKEAAAYSRTGVTKLRELIDAGKLRSYRLDDAKSKSTILLHRKDLDAVILFDRSSGLTKRESQRLQSYTK
ncbi:MAG: helix-turn-helix domain-containing protein [Candidatus Marinimicrobia bacterium]|nr:helix-turn-helix domain-containing protein [Candidatus Neomarinimicrobiota bacterium]